MRLTRFTDYSLRVLMYLAARRGDHATIAEIAAAFAISESHLTKVVHFLGKRGLLSNTRGRGGGVELGRPPDRINIGALVRAAEADTALVECFDPRTNQCVIAPVCGLRSVLGEALEALYATLDGYTLEDITHNKRPLQKAMAATSSGHR
jgi:Rrf2 family nitric oxide-sensitive transcriptional repressor